MTVGLSGPKLIKKPYTTPRLVVYGDITAITRASSSGSKNDHAGGNVKTS
jgi:hypothetical protein